MNSLELVNELYSPYKITKLGKVTILDSMDGKFVVKPKGKKDVKELFKYLKYRSFTEVPTLVDDTRSDIDIFEYVEDANIPREQKAQDMIKLVAKLHTKTSYEKEVREDKYKEIYDSIKGQLLYHENLYRNMVETIENHIFMSPYEYLFIRNSSKLFNQIAFVQSKLDDWYQETKNKRKTRVSVVHNNLSLDHYLKGEREALISWDKSSVDSPILDFYTFYQKEALNFEFSGLLSEYMKMCPLESEERELLFILLCLPREIKLGKDEFSSVAAVGEVLDYVFKTEHLVGAYYAVDSEE